VKLKRGGGGGGVEGVVRGEGGDEKEVRVGGQR